MAKVLIENLHKNFGEVKAVNNVSLEIEDKEFHVLLGPSGCGKTTILRCIAGLETASSGDVFIDNKRVNDIPAKDRDVSMVFQSYALFPHMNVFNNIGFPLKMRKYPKQEIRSKVKKAACLLKIEEYLDRMPKELSGGQMQRVALGRAIVREPKVFLMDEPLSNLDAKLRIYMRAELKALQKRLGITTIYVTHDQVEAMTMADRISILNGGILQQTGTSTEIYHYPSNTFVGGFIGSPPMNFLDCYLIKEKNKLLIKSSNCSIDISYLMHDEINGDKKIAEEETNLILGFRPEDATVEKKRPSGPSIEAKIYVLEPLGSQILVSLLVDDFVVKSVENPSREYELSQLVGQKVWLKIDMKKIHLFDKKKGSLII